MAEKIKVLLIDDEEVFGVMVKMNLEASGDYEVSTETKGRQAMAAVKRFKPDIIFLDVIMPDMGGVEVYNELKEYCDKHSVPVIFLTALVSDKDVYASMGNIGGHPFLAKPVTTEKLISSIRENI